MNTPHIQTHPLVIILKEEITSIESQITSNRRVNQSQNLQTSAFLGLSRGTTSRRSDTPRTIQPVDTISDIFSNLSMNTTTPFSNRVQRQISQEAQIFSQTQDPCDES